MPAIPANKPEYQSAKKIGNDHYFSGQFFVKIIQKASQHNKWNYIICQMGPIGMYKYQRKNTPEILNAPWKYSCGMKIPIHAFFQYKAQHHDYPKKKGDKNSI